MSTRYRIWFAAFAVVALLVFGQGMAAAVQIVLVGDHVRVQPVAKDQDPFPDVTGKAKKAIVVDKGPAALEVKLGDRVLFGKYSGSEIKIGDEEFVILREDEILAVLE